MVSNEACVFKHRLQSLHRDTSGLDAYVAGL